MQIAHINTGRATLRKARRKRECYDLAKTSFREMEDHFRNVKLNINNN